MRNKNMRTAFAVMALVLSLALLGGCNGQPNKSTPTSTVKPESEPTATEAQAALENDSKPAAAEVKAEGRIMELIQAWTNAGISAELVETTKNNTLNMLFGSTKQHLVNLEDQQFMVFEYDLNDLSGTASSVLEHADKQGRDLKSDDPVWHNQEFLLRNTYSVLENGEVVNEYKVESHPKSQQILEAFKAFK
ncbi:MAG: hypothetical protein GX635_00740 [Synergistaceae bacterium]|nr:hypothetical protein [Synergistaceae bacterium]